MTADAKIPWPGPVPLDEEQRDQLFGRDGDIEQVLVALRRYSVVEIVAPTGVGKTSLLRAGVIGEIRRQGLSALLCRDWSSLPVRGAGMLYCQLIDKAIDESGLDAPRFDDFDSPLDFLGALDKHMRVLPSSDAEQLPFPSKLVVVFDQVEELLRYDKAVGLDFLRHVADAADKFAFRQVVSLRREFKADLKELETHLVRNFSYLDIEPISADAIHDLIVQPLRESKWLSFSNSVINEVEQLWTDASKGSDPTAPELARRSSMHRGGDAVGLLHMQALLWSLSEWCLARNYSSVDGAEFVQFSNDLKQDTDTDGGDTFAGALRHYVDVRLDEKLRGLDDPRTGATVKLVVAKMAPQLSSSSYKLIREASDLLWQSLDESFRELNLSEDIVLRLWPKRVDSNEMDSLHLADSTQERTAGRMKGSTIGDAADGLLEAFNLALAWLAEARIISDSTTPQSGRMITLVHDGFGPALIGWARSAMRDPNLYIESLTAISGADLVWDNFPKDCTVSDVRWRGCYINTGCESVKFVDCDLRGSLIDRSTLQNVQFVQCDLRGAKIGNTRFEGAQGILISGGELEAFGIQEVSGSGELSIEGVHAKGVFLEDLAIPSVKIRNSALRMSVINGLSTETSKVDVDVSGSTLNQWYFGNELGSINIAESTVILSDSVSRVGSMTTLENCEVVASTFAYDSSVELRNCDVIDWSDFLKQSVELKKGAGVDHRHFRISTGQRTRNN